MNTLNEHADHKGRHSFLLFYFCLYVADPATFLASNSVMFIFSLRTACLFSYGEKYIFLSLYYNLFYIVNIQIQTSKLHSAPLKFHFTYFDSS